MERRNCQVFTVRVTIPGTVAIAAQRQGWSEIAIGEPLWRYLQFRTCSGSAQADSGVALAWV